jgi:hypothetical protein
MSNGSGTKIDPDSQLSRQNFEHDGVQPHRTQCQIEGGGHQTLQEQWVDELFVCI